MFITEFLAAIFAFLRGVFTIANTFIAVFIMVYAFFFVKRTRSHKERRPWDYLYIASIVYAIFSFLLMLVSIYNIHKIGDFNMFELTVFIQFVYSGLILLAFVNQTDLIFKNELIIITRKLNAEDANLDNKLLEKEVKKETKLEVAVGEERKREAQLEKEMKKQNLLIRTLKKDYVFMKKEYDTISGDPAEKPSEKRSVPAVKKKSSAKKANKKKSKK